ncbi:S8 family serine peptidase [Corynebacterium mastitidis]
MMSPSWCRLGLVGVLFAALIAAAPALHTREGCVGGVPAPGPTAPPTAPANSLSGRGVTVAVIDTGVTPHPQLAEVIPGSDFVSPEDPAPLLDCDGHGTVVAGLIASRDAGVAPGAAILSIRQTTTAPPPPPPGRSTPRVPCPPWPRPSRRPWIAAPASSTSRWSRACLPSAPAASMPQS